MKTRVKSTRNSPSKTLLQTLVYGVLQSGEPTQRETKDLMNKKNIFVLFFFLSLEFPLRKFPIYPSLKFSLFALFFIFILFYLGYKYYVLPSPKKKFSPLNLTYLNLEIIEDACPAFLLLTLK